MGICTVSPEPLLLVYWRVRKLSTPSLKDVDCILASYIAYRSSNKTQFCSMIMHVHHKSDLSEGSDEFAHFARIQKVLPEGGRLWQRFFFCCFFLVDEGRDCRTNDGPTFNAGLVTLWFFQEIFTSIARKPYSFVIFRGGGSRPHVPPLNPPMRIRTVWVQTPCPPLNPPMRIRTVSPEPLLLVYWR